MRILDKNRKKYKRIFASEGECTFCSRKEVLICPSLKSNFWQVFANKFPYMDGNVMIVPVRHIEKVEDINDEEWIDFGKTLSKTQKVLGDIFEVESFNVGLNVGLESGASIPHIHWQVIPRKFKNITVMNTFADLYIVTVSGEETVKRIEKYLKT
ncbi:MAG: histidine triad (HIT) protein [uncultured bacterium]|nr:MAG: histidine triad (HIT) protein [uncultured bacterium]